MATANPRKLFLNLPVRDLKKSMDFFAALGFTFNPQFTDEKAACMVFSEDAYAMLLHEPYFKTFTKRPIVDARQQTEGIFALSCTSRAEVDEILKSVVDGSEFRSEVSRRVAAGRGDRCQRAPSPSVGYAISDER